MNRNHSSGYVKWQQILFSAALYAHANLAVLRASEKFHKGILRELYASHIPAVDLDDPVAAHKPGPLARAAWDHVHHHCRVVRHIEFYADAAEITANEYSKGPVTLYAVWNRVNYFISYELNGGTATNPSSYTEATETFTLANPTRENSTFLGWVGSNGSTPEMTVTIAQGSTGDKTFIAHWECATSTTVIGLIDAIGEVEHTSESKAKIDAARAAYDALTAGEKADVPAPKLETLRIAEATYAANEQSTIRFMEQDGQTQVGEDQQRAIYYPSFPAGATKWQTTEKNASDKTIVIKAVE